MQPQQRGSTVLLHSSPCRGCSLLFLCLLSLSFSSWRSPLISLASADPVALPQKFTPAVSLRPESLLDTFVCMSSSSKTGEDPFSPTSDDDDVFLDDWKPQLPCVESRSVNVFLRNHVEAGNVLLMTDIDDTLIASGGWTWIGKSLGGTDDRYIRGSEYPGFGSFLYLLGLGPHLRDATTEELKLYKPPLPVAVVTGRPNVSFFRPDYLLPHIDAILTKGARQVTSDDDMSWKVGAENSVLSPKVFKGVNGRGELKVAFILSAIRGKEHIEGARVDASTKYMFVGDTGERDPEVALAVATVEPAALVAVFLNVVHRSEDPLARQTIAGDSEDEEECDQYQEEDSPTRALPGTETLSALGQRVSNAMQGAVAKIAAVAGRSSGEETTQKLSPGHDTSLNMDFIQLLAAAEKGRAGPLFMDGQAGEKMPHTPQERTQEEDSVVIQIEEPDTENHFNTKIKKLASHLAEAAEEAFARLDHDIVSQDPLWPLRLMREAPSSGEDLRLKKTGEITAAEEDGSKVEEASAPANSEQQEIAEVATVLRATGDKVDEGQAVQRALHSHRMRNPRRKHTPPRVSVSQALANTRRFAIQVGETLVDAIQVAYDVHITTDDWEAPQSCSALNTRQAYAVGSILGQKLRNIFDAYEHRWKHTPDSFNVSAPGIAGLSSTTRGRIRRPLPLIFVKCNSVKLHLTHSPSGSNWRNFWTFFTESSDRIDVNFIIPEEPLQTSASARFMSSPNAGEEGAEDNVLILLDDLNQQRIGTPVAPYTTTLSASAHAYVLGLMDLIDVSVVVESVSISHKTLEHGFIETNIALRSQGPLSHSTRLPVLLDHLNDLEALKYLFFGHEKATESPVKEIAALMDNYLVSQYAFAKRATYVRAFPNRQHECVHDLQRALLEKSRATRGQKNPWRFNRGKLVAFGTPFASLVCEYDLELASIHQAGPGELVGLSYIITKAVREALLATERVKCEGDSQRCRTTMKSANRNMRRGDIDDSESEEVEVDGHGESEISERCGLDEAQLRRFHEYYIAMCEAFSPIACQLLEARLNSSVLEDLILLADSKITNRSDPVDLPHFGLRVFPDENVQDYFENLHQRPAAQFLGFLGNPVDYALQPTEDGIGHFEKWPAVESAARWKTILETLQQMLYCDLIG